MVAFGLSVDAARIETFGRTTALVIELFDTPSIRDVRLLRLPQEDCCQALSAPPTFKYQSEGGPGIGAITGLLRASVTLAQAREAFLKTQVIFLADRDH